MSAAKTKKEESSCGNRQRGESNKRESKHRYCIRFVRPYRAKQNMALRTTASALWSRFVPAARQAMPAGSSSFFRQVRRVGEQTGRDEETESISGFSKPTHPLTRFPLRLMDGPLPLPLEKNSRKYNQPCRVASSPPATRAKAGRTTKMRMMRMMRMSTTSTR